MKCYLHIGTEKTATSTIQSFLDINRSVLLKQGFIYTQSVGKRNNIILPILAYNSDRRDAYTKSHGIDSNKKLSAFQKKTRYSLKQEIQNISRDNPDATILFSSELIQSRLTTHNEILRLKDILEDCGITDIFVIVYIRNPADTANSLYSTAIKSGNTGKQPPPPEQAYYARICNHQATLERFGAVFGEDNLIPKIFHKDDFKNQSILDDFLEIIGLSMHNNSFVLPENKNKSISATGLYLLNHLNQVIPRYINNKPNPLRDDLSTYFHTHFTGNPYIMPGALYDDYNKAFQESNEWVRKKYFPNKAILFPLSIPEDTQPPLPEHELQQIADCMAAIWLDKQKMLLEQPKYCKLFAKLKRFISNKSKRLFT